MRLLLAIFFAGLSLISVAQTSDTECIDCHSDNTLTMERKGKEVSLFVDKDHFSNSLHGSLNCTDCHSGFSSENIPHKEGDNIASVDCAQCHDTEAFSSSIHGKKKVECFSCHTKHEIQNASELVSNQVSLCISCHKSSSITVYKQSIHHTKFLAGAGKAPTCITCHNNSAHNIQSANFSKADEEKLCASCHKRSDEEFAISIHSLAKKKNTPGCVSCHGAHAVYNNKFSISSQSCLKCHLDTKNFKDERSHLVGFVQNYQTSVHARIGENGEAATCVDCHDNHMIMGTDASQSKITRENIPLTCGRCHQQVVSKFKKSSHGISFYAGSKLSPVCTDCHGEHTITRIDRSPLSKIDEHNRCFSCHVSNPEVIKASRTSKKEIQQYESSVHFQALKNGNEAAATCSDCHTGHSSLPAHMKQSKINKQNVAATCGSQSGCHQNITGDYMESIHAKAVAEGKMDAPTCTDCHGNHQVLSKENPKSSVYEGKSIVLLCSSCHDNVELTEKYGIPEARTSSYSESYHGLAVRGGSKYAADCASCHGSHSIKPSSDPASSIHISNLSSTCGQCHPGANINAEFAKVHLTGSREESSLLFWISRIYIILIIVIIGGMLLHNILDFVRKKQEHNKHRAEKKKLREEGKYYLRMSFNERIQHFVMLTSFIALVFTGFALKYPDAWWVIPFRTILGEWAFQTRSIAHRFFGIAMIIISLYHFYYIIFTARGRKLAFDFLPTLKDLKDFIVNVKYLVGISKIKPQFDRFSYMEKAEYWALVWGVIIMSATGLVLFFNNFFLSVAPKIFMDISTVVHLYEAWLATLAIVVWHFYFVIFNPEVYPLNTAFIEGTLSEEVMIEEHPLELERIKNSVKSESDVNFSENENNEAINSNNNKATDNSEQK